MPAPVVRVSGARQFRSAARRAGEDLADLRAVNAAAAEVVARRAGVDVPVVSGALAATLRFSGTQSAAIIRAGRASVPYAGVIHYGWPARNIEPQPFITDAAAETQPTWLGLYTRGVQAILDRLADRAHP